MFKLTCRGAQHSCQPQEKIHDIVFLGRANDNRSGELRHRAMGGVDVLNDRGRVRVLWTSAVGGHIAVSFYPDQGDAVV